MPDGKKLEPLIYEHETEEEAASYDRWLRARIQKSLDDPRPSIPNEEVVRGAEAIIRAAEAGRAVK